MSSGNYALLMASLPREGVIIEWPLNGQFHDAGDLILTSQTDVREMVDDDHDDEWPLVIYIFIYRQSSIFPLVTKTHFS